MIKNKLKTYHVALTCGASLFILCQSVLHILAGLALK